MRAGGGFGVVLHAECVQVLHPQPFDHAIVQVHVRDFDVGGQAVGLHRKAVVVAADLNCAIALSTGWLPPRWPNFILYVWPPSARPRIWWPRQMPNTGTLPSSARVLSMAYVQAAGSPGPFDRNTPSGCIASTSLGCCCRRHHGYAASVRSQQPQNIALYAEVVGDDVGCGCAEVRRCGGVTVCPHAPLRLCSSASFAPHTILPSPPRSSDMVWRMSLRAPGRAPFMSRLAEGHLDQSPWIGVQR